MEVVKSSPGAWCYIRRTPVSQGYRCTATIDYGHVVSDLPFVLVLEGTTRNVARKVAKHIAEAWSRPNLGTARIMDDLLTGTLSRGYVSADAEPG